MATAAVSRMSSRAVRELVARARKDLARLEKLLARKRRTRERDEDDEDDDLEDDDDED